MLLALFDQCSLATSRPAVLHAEVVLVCRFNKVRFTIQAVHTAASQPSASAAEVQKVEAQLLQKKSEMRLFESQYRQVSRAPVTMHMCGPPCTCTLIWQHVMLAAGYIDASLLQQRVVEQVSL